MKISIIQIIELSKEEAIALKQWLSTRSDNAGTAVGISREGNNFLSKLFRELVGDDD